MAKWKTHITIDWNFGIERRGIVFPTFQRSLTTIFSTLFNFSVGVQYEV